MEYFEVKLTQGQPHVMPLQGTFFRILAGSGKFRLRTYPLPNDTRVTSTMYLPGLGITIPPFAAIEITSLDSTQTVTGIVSQFNVADSRLVGELASSFVTSSFTIATATSALLFPINLSRKNIDITTDQNLYVKATSPAANTDFLVYAGSFSFQNTGELYAFNDSGLTCNVSVLEELA